MKRTFQKLVKMLGGNGVARLALVAGIVMAIMCALGDFPISPSRNNYRPVGRYRYSGPDLEDIILNSIVGFSIGFSCPIATAWVWRGFKKG